MPVALGTGVPFKSKFSGTVVDPGLALLQGATLWLNAAQSVAGEQSVVNQGTGGSALDARYGSTTGVDTNDPLLLTHTDTNYLYLPGIAGNSATVPDSAAISITGDMDLIACLAPTSWASGARQNIATKGDTGAQDSYMLALTSSGAIELVVNNAAGSYIGSSSTAAVGFSAGQLGWVRATVDIDNGSNSVFKFYTSPDGAIWTQLGSTTTSTRITTNVRDGSSVLGIGQFGSAAIQLLTGAVYRVRILNGYDGAGSVVFDADFTSNTNQSSFTESSSNAATVTINRATSGRKAVMVTRPVWLFGTDDYMEIADNALLDFEATGDMTVLAVCRRSATAPSNGRIISKRDGSGTNPGWDLLNESATLGFTALVDVGGSNNTFPTNVQQTMTANQLHLIGAIFDRTNSLVKASIGNSISTGSTMPAGDASTTKGVFIGRLEGATPAYNDMEIVAVALFRSALTSTQLGQIATYYGV